MFAILCCLIFSCSTATANDVVYYRVYQGSIDSYIDTSSGNSIELYSHIHSWQSTAIYVHGWREDCRNASAIEVISAILSLGGMNVCCLDWSAISKQSYLRAATGTHDVAAIFAKDLSGMADMGFELGTMIICGFSLGAHIAGAAGKNLQEGGYANIRQITGLDPAKPLFDPRASPKCRSLESTDADMVFIIHTSGGDFGIARQIGKCDFYPNYGIQIQKGCPLVPTTIDPNQPLLTYRCSHDRSWRLLGDAIRNPNTQIALKCGSSLSFSSNSCSGNTMISVDLFMPKNVSGTYYYMTNGESPYGRSELGTRPSSL